MQGKIRRWRRALQLVTLAALVAAPFLNVFRIDLHRDRVYLYGHVYPLLATNSVGIPLLVIIPIAFILALFLFLFALSFVLERAFCGWFCPQGLLAETGDQLGVLLRGRWGLWGGSRAPGRRWRLGGWSRAGAWVGLTGAAVIAAGILAFAALSYLVDPSYLLGSISGLREPWVAAYLAVTALIFLDIVWLRHLWCRLCPFGTLYQLVFAWLAELLRYSFPGWGDTLRVRFQRDREADCARCRYCEKVCFMGVPILSRDDSPECVDCGECVEACAAIMAGKGRPPILDFSPPRPGRTAGPKGEGAWLFHLSRRAVTGTVLALLAVAITAAPLLVATGAQWKLETRSGSLEPGGARFTYRVSVTNNGLAAHNFRLVPEGLPRGVAYNRPEAIIPSQATRQLVLRVRAEGSPTPYLGMGTPFRLALWEGAKRIAEMPLTLHISGSLG